MMDERVGAQYQNWYDRSSLRAAAVRERSASATRPAAEQRREGSARHALGDQLIGVGGNHVRIVPAHVVPAQVVHHHLVHSSCSAGREDRSAGAERARGGGASERSAEEQKPMALALTMTMCGLELKSGMVDAVAVPITARCARKSMLPV